MKNVWKIIKIILVFFLSLAIIASAWYAIEVATLSKNERAIPFIDFVLYLLGFGDLEIENHYLQTAFSTLGLFAVTLLSSVFTVNLFELRSKVKINPSIVVKSKQFAILKLKSTGKDIYDLTATLISKCGQDVTAEEQRFPFVAKKSSQELTFKIEPGSAIYKYLRSVYMETEESPQLILTVSYTDIESGQAYAMAQKYQYSKEKKRAIIFSGDDSEIHRDDFEAIVRDSIVKKTFPINLSKFTSCNGEDIDISYGYRDKKLIFSNERAFRAVVHMNSDKLYEPNIFTMAYTNDLLENDWTAYYDLGCALRFDYKVTGDMVVTMELKCGADNAVKRVKRLTPYDTFETYILNLSELKREDLACVRELCFTVFYKDVNSSNPVGSFVIRNCALEVVGKKMSG